MPRQVISLWQKGVIQDDHIKPSKGSSGADRDQSTFAVAFGMTTPQAMNNKLRRDSWSAKDLAKAAALCGAKLAFILPDGSQLILAPDEE